MRPLCRILYSAYWKLDEFHIRVTTPFNNPIYCCRWSGKKGMKNFVKMHKQVQRHIFRFWNSKEWEKYFSVSFTIDIFSLSNGKQGKKSIQNSESVEVFSALSIHSFQLLFLIRWKKRNEKEKNSFKNSWHVILPLWMSIVAMAFSCRSWSTSRSI